MGSKFLQKKKAAEKKKSQKKTLDLGALASSSKLIKKAKTHKGRKFLEKRAPQLIEGKKTAIFVKGKKASAVLQSVMRDLIQMRGEVDNSRVFMRSGHDMHPFENMVPLESMASKQDCALFCFGHNQKKRPDNLIIGRTFDGRALDTFELGIENYKGITEYPAQEVSRDIKPVILFQGEQFEFSEKHQRLKNVLYGKLQQYENLLFRLEFFHQKDLKEANIVELKRVLVFTSVDDTTIQVRHFEVSSKITEAGITAGQVDLREVGPHFDLKLRRHVIASGDLYKAACRKPKVANVEKKKAKKNMFTNELGERRGKVYLQQQDLQTMATRKFRKQKPEAKKIEAEDV